MSKTYPEFTTKPEASNHRCPMGYAPTIPGGPCMFCDHSVRSSCHLDFGKDRYGRTIIDRSPLGPGERLRVRYANQTVVYKNGMWADLVVIRETLAALRDDLRFRGAAADIENAVRDLDRVVSALPGER